MKVVYYTSTHFLDAVFEQLKKTDKQVKLYLFIEVNPFSRISTIVEINKRIPNVIIPVKDNLNKEAYNIWHPYITHMQEVNFINFSSKKSLGIKTFLEGQKLKKKIKDIKPDVIHFDTISSRTFSLLPLLKRYRVIISIHDARPHSGEDSWKEYINNKLFYRFSYRFLFHSVYSLREFIKEYPCYVNRSTVIPLLPYTVSRSFLTTDHKSSVGKYILFFGRISAYKGVDLLLEVFEKISKNYPDWNLIVAGKEVYRYEMDKNLMKSIGRQLIYIPEYLPARKLMPMIARAEFIVCPYLEASQSGVLMTALALGKCVLATNVGAFSEYIKDGVNGYLCEPTKESLECKLREIIEDRLYRIIEGNLKKTSTSEDHLNHYDKLIKIWSR